jgi:hypothetical protein
MEVPAGLMKGRLTRDAALAVLDDAIKLHQGNISILHAVLDDGTGE